MNMEQYIRAIAGSFVSISVLLAYLYSPYWLFFTTFVGLNLLQSSFTKWCPMELFLEKLGVPRDNGQRGRIFPLNAKHPYPAETNQPPLAGLAPYSNQRRGSGRHQEAR